MVIEIDFNSDEAIYVQLMNQIIMGIATSRLQEGDPLPSVRQLADTVGINMHTVNKAYSLLRQEGFVTIDRRRGAIIAVDENKIKAMEEMKENLIVALAKGCCRNVSREEVHGLIDEIYDEYGIDLDEEEEALKAKKKEEKQEKKAQKASKQVSKKASKKYDDEDEFEGYDEDDLWVTENIAKAMEKPKKQKSVKHATAKKAAAKGVRSLDETGPAIRKPVKNINLQDTYDFEKFSPLDEEEFDNFEGYYSDDDYDMFGSNDYDYDDDELFDATADLLSNHPEKKKSHAEMDDTFKMDVIDLD